VWHPAAVIARLSSIYPYDSVPLKIITRKLVFLLVLGTGHQVQTLCSIKMSQISLKEKLIIRISDRIKTSKLGRYQPFFCFSCFYNHENLCIVRLTEQYINITRDLHPSTYEALFISLTKPHKAITSQTMNRWIKQGLEECGVDTTVFSTIAPPRLQEQQKRGLLWI